MRRDIVSEKGEFVFYLIAESERRWLFLIPLFLTFAFAWTTGVVNLSMSWIRDQLKIKRSFKIVL